MAGAEKKIKDPDKEIKIVNTNINHLDDIIEIEKLSFSIPWSRNAFLEELQNNRFAVYISAMANEKVVGYAGMWKIIDEGHITNIAVHPEYRRMGIGKKLLEELINISKKSGITRITLEVRKSNTVAQSLYIKYGFKPAGIRKEYYADNGEDAIIMWKENL